MHHLHPCITCSLDQVASNAAGFPGKHMTSPDLLHMQVGAPEAQQQALQKLLSASMHADDISCSERWPQLLQGLCACCSTPGCADAAAQLVAKLAPHLMRQSPEQSAELLLAIRLYLCSKTVELDAEGECLRSCHPCCACTTQPAYVCMCLRHARVINGNKVAACGAAWQSQRLAKVYAA